MKQNTIEDMMKAYSKDAIDLGKQLGKKLDYSEESIKHVEGILELYHSSLPRGFFQKLIKLIPSEDKIIQMAKTWGGYIGEVIRRNIGGQWSLESETIVLVIGKTVIFPPAKVYKRIKNGTEENVWHYYLMIKQDMNNMF